ncbi:MAG: hypothetical protein KKA73_26730 [Chloroflexi bacterium]|nr:hypothetical protein [Chloroflexota bacterium]MBU1751297.1 hypothetical protein [Chloroflexota bacterium]
MNSPDSRRRELVIDDELDELIRDALAEDCEFAEPSSLVWARIQAEIEADQVPVWVAWGRRLRIACHDTLPRIVPQAVVVTLFILLGGLGLRGYDWFAMPLTATTGSPAEQRQITTAERLFYDQYHTEYYVIPVDAPPKNVQRTAPRPPTPPVGPQHLAVGAMNPS